MSAPVCPECNGSKFNVCRGIPVAFVECAACNWTQTPDEDLLILAALETYRRNQPKEAA